MVDLLPAVIRVDRVPSTTLFGRVSITSLFSLIPTDLLSLFYYFCEPSGISRLIINFGFDLISPEDVCRHVCYIK